MKKFMRRDAKMNETVLSIVERIKHGYKPEKIILFGSYACDKQDKGSDIDLIIIKKTKEDAWERAAKVDGLMDHKVPVDILIYTPEEIQQRLAINDDFVKEFNKKGKVLYNG